ncbi:hypothetical protein [Simplicispira suum]|uniref:Uncharacterized protein n=1 Tax=Simplicispira suum TaxID=2109915 RepID=A0A2S0MW84_9BURK|nr:hypothetical protein [Simplicispira suum]AVO40145.1 hypothetical protein C6571_01540 [Simplicispira suum]
MLLQAARAAWRRNRGSGIANAAPHYNGTVKGEIDGKKLDVKVVCERSKIGKMDSLSARSDPGMEIDAKDRNGDGIAVSVTGDMSQPAAAFTMLVGGKVYKFGARRDLKVTATGLSLKAHFKPAPNKPELTAYDVDLTLECA